jgi:DNA-directed RNA polymerase subunit RPC12/RpoP
MSSILYKYVCASCGYEFKAPGAPEMSYGEFVLRSESGDEAYLEAVTNNTFNEVSQIVESNPLLEEVSESKSADILQKVFSVACDPAPSGKALQIGLMPACPICSSREMASWGEVYPTKVVPIPMVKHTLWDRLTASEKRTLVDTEVRKNMNPRANQ